MSSSNIASRLSNLLTLANPLLGALKLGGSPVSAGITGFMTTARFLAYTMVGRLIIVVSLTIGVWFFFSHHFRAVEAHKWEAKVEVKQAEIIEKVARVNDATKTAQQTKQIEVTWWNKILAVVTDGIQKVQPPHPIEKETIDLINETRGKQQKY